jgi:two-component system CheB/CheR fusion protein
MTVQADSTIQQKRCRILLVDDSAVALKATKIMLELSGHEVHAAATAASAIEAAGDFQPDLVVSDLRLPDMTGYELLRLLKENKSLANTLFIALSGYGDEEAERARQAGFDEYIIKPMDLEAFDRLIVEKRKAARSQPSS